GRILAGQKPGELPILQPSKIELIVNAKAAREIGIAVPPTILARADDILECVGESRPIERPPMWAQPSAGSPGQHGHLGPERPVGLWFAGKRGRVVEGIVGP